MSKQVKNLLSILIPILLGIFFIWIAYQKISDKEIEQIFALFKNIDYFYLYLSIFFCLIASISRAYRWRYTLEHLGYQVPFKNKFLAVNVGYLMNMFVPRSGEVSRALVLKNYNEVPFDKSFGTIVAERAIDMALLVLFIAVTFFLQFDIVKIFILDHLEPKTIIILGIIGMVGLALVYYLYRYSTLTIIQTLKSKLQGLKEGIMSTFTMKNKTPFMIHTMIIWVAYILMFYSSTFIFEETSSLSFAAVLTTFIVGSIAVAFTNNGFGAYPYLVSEILLFYGISASAGIAFGWIAWISQTIFTLVLGLISMFLLPLLNKK